MRGWVLGWLIIFLILGSASFITGFYLGLHHGW